MNKNDTSPTFHWADALLILLVLFWGGNFAAVKFGLAEIPPAMFNALRYTIAAVVMMLFILITRQPYRIKRQHIPYLIITGILGNSGYPLFFAFGLAYTTAGNSVLILSTLPAWVALFGTLIGVEKIGKQGWVGVTLSVFGIILVIAGGRGQAGFRFGGASLYGDLIVVGALLCWTAYTMALKPLTKVYPPAVVSSHAMTVGIIPMVLVSLPTMVNFQWTTVSLAAWASLLITGVFAVGLAYIFWGYGVAHLGSTRTSLYLNLVPPIALLVNWLWLGETLTPIQWVGSAIALIGVAIARRHTTSVSGSFLERLITD